MDAAMNKKLIVGLIIAILAVLLAVSGGVGAAPAAQSTATPTMQISGFFLGDSLGNYSIGRGSGTGYAEVWQNIGHQPPPGYDMVGWVYTVVYDTGYYIRRHENLPSYDAWFWGQTSDQNVTVSGDLVCSSGYYAQFTPTQICDQVTNNATYKGLLNTAGSAYTGESKNHVWSCWFSPGKTGPCQLLDLRPIYAYRNGNTPVPATRTSTPTGTPQYATGLPFPTLPCITATNVLSGATPTPFIAGSASPTPTGTWATATPAVTSTTTSQNNTFLSEVFEFDNSLSPWTKFSAWVASQPVEAAWSHENGPDGISGTVRMTYNTLSHPVTSTVGPLGGIVWTRGTGVSNTVPGPLFLKLSIKSDNLFNGRWNWVALWAKDSRGLWAVIDQDTISTGWREITLNASNFEPYTYLGLAVYSCYDQNWESCEPTAYSDGVSAGALVDNIQIIAGNNASTLAFQACPQGNGKDYKICRLYINSVDVFSRCTTPADWSNVSGWVSWLGCRIEKYFSFDQQVNGGQLQRMYTFGYTQEPMGTMLDVGILVQQGRDTFIAIENTSPKTFGVPNFDSLFSTSGLGPIDLYVPQPGNTLYLDQCPDQFDTVNEGVRRGLCFGIYMIKSQPATHAVLLMFNWMLNIGAFLFMLTTGLKAVQVLSV